MDAKKIFVPNLGPLGCIPGERDLNYRSWYKTSDSCFSTMNDAVIQQEIKEPNHGVEPNSCPIQICICRWLQHGISYFP